MVSTTGAQSAPRRFSTMSRLTGVQKRFEWLQWGATAQTAELNSFDSKLSESSSDAHSFPPSPAASPSSPSTSLRSEDTRVTPEEDERLMEPSPEAAPSSLLVTSLVCASSSTEHLTSPPTSFDAIETGPVRPRSSSRRSSSASVYSMSSYVGGWVSSMFTPAPPRPKRRPSSGEDDFSSYISLTEIQNS